MSQAKVDYKKEQKKNIKKTVRNRKIRNIVTTCVLVVVAAGMLGWLGYSGYKSYETAKEDEPKESISVNLDSISDYISSLSSDSEE